MNPWQKQVQTFHKAINQPHEIGEVKMRNPMFRARLLIEESIETVFALVGSAEGYTTVQDVLRKVLETSKQKGICEKPDLLEAIDGLCDTIVVACGTGLDLGVNLAPFMDEVMSANMRKLGGPVDEHGKKLKPPGWTPPDIAGVLSRHLGEHA